MVERARAAQKVVERRRDGQETMLKEHHSTCHFAEGLHFAPYGIDHLVDHLHHHRLPLDPESPLAIQAYSYETFPSVASLTWHSSIACIRLCWATRICSIRTRFFSTHVTVNRTRNLRVIDPYFSPADLGIQVHIPVKAFTGVSVTGNGFAIGSGATNPGYFNSTNFQLAEDVDLIRGSHQLLAGVTFIHNNINTSNNRPSNGQFTFNAMAKALTSCSRILWRAR